MAKYRVHGYALCSVEVEMVIEAADGPAAVMAAQARFEASNRKGGGAWWMAPQMSGIRSSGLRCWWVKSNNTEINRRICRPEGGSNERRNQRAAKPSG